MTARPPDLDGPWRPTRAEVDVDAIAANVATLASVTGVAVCAVVKADGYGHGAVTAARAALAGGARSLAVALVEEGVALRRAGIDAPVLLLSEPPVAAIDAVIAWGLTATVYRAPFVAALDARAQRLGRKVPVHPKVDTGMARVGIVEDAWEERFAQLRDARGLDVEGLQTHLARAEEVGADANLGQLAAFERALALAGAHGLAPRLVHVANTAAALTRPAARYTMVRTGIGVYGVSPGGDVDAAAHGLRPALRLVSEVALVKRVPAGTPVSYGHRWSAPADGWLATVPIGYADGVPRAVTGRGEVLVAGARRPIAGAVTMDQLLVWCGDHEPAVGDEVVLLGRAREHDAAPAVRAEEVAGWAGTIAYEVLTGIGPRVPRVPTSEVPRG